jgi:hypothetical protein
MQLQRWAVGVHAEAKAFGNKAQGVFPEEEVEVVDQDQPQGEEKEPRYQEYLSDIPQEWDTEETDVPEWDNDFDNDTRTEYQVNMILIGKEYHERKQIFMAKHVNDMPSILRQEVETKMG